MNNNNQVHKVYLASGMDINAISNTKAFEPPSIFTISGLNNSLNSRVELVHDDKDDDDEDDGDSDVISELIGHIGPWQLFWAFIMCLYQFPTTFHIFCLVFQVSFARFMICELIYCGSELIGRLRKLIRKKWLTSMKHGKFV